MAQCGVYFKNQLPSNLFKLHQIPILNASRLVLQMPAQPIDAMYQVENEDIVV